MSETTRIILFFILIGATFLITYVFPFLYFKWGIGKLFFHNVLGWHTPDEKEGAFFDGVSLHSKCKYCGKEIMQDSQGNWF